ncbi:triggering receptor expressed on myeloid cells 2-like [Mauremys mutica]|uniref:triggering receptor expressed on myeloid cells 2-like n=1 Tax=Mauremys mutica TaxID=74926 RepID=UPI001D162544|nr:triggering receptor expressed on myeloid cells 2-like [Mauremys mutica]
MEGTSITITCSYDRRTNMFNRKYWCRGGSRSSCDVLGDTENFVKSEYKERLSLLDNRRGYFLVTMHQLVEEDSGMYWCGIQRPYADIMTAVKLTVTEEPLSTPLITLTNHPSESCLGRSVTVRCHSATGSNVYYTWYRKSFPTNIVLVHSSDLVLRCGDLLESQSYFCQAATRRANKSTQVLRAEVLTPAKENCTYQLQLTDGESYNCVRTTPVFTVEMPSTPFTGYSTPCPNSSSHPGIEDSWIPVPWAILRWLFLLILVATLIIIQSNRTWKSDFISRIFEVPPSIIPPREGQRDSHGLW